MNSVEKAEWTAALRSGEFPQGKFRLSEYGHFCCLGVKCELDVRKGLMQKRGEVEIEYAEDDSDDFLACAPSVATSNRWGITYPNIDLLTGFNDRTRWTFTQIADWIDENF